MNKGFELFSPSNKKAALLLHGLASSPWEMSSLADFLFKKGWNIKAPLIMDLKSYEDNNFKDFCWADSLNTCKKNLLSYSNIFKTIVIGTSFGGILATLLAERFSSISAIILVNPPFKLKNPLLRLLLKTDLPLKGFKTKPPNNYKSEYFPYFPFKVLKEMIEASKESLMNAKKISKPLMLFYSIRDRAVSFSAIKEFVTKIESPVKFLQKIYGPHSLLAPYYKNNILIFERIDSFLKEIIGD